MFGLTKHDYHFARKVLDAFGLAVVVGQDKVTGVVSAGEVNGREAGLLFGTGRH